MSLQIVGIESGATDRRMQRPVRVAHESNRINYLLLQTVKDYKRTSNKRIIGREVIFQCCYSVNSEHFNNPIIYGTCNIDKQQPGRGQPFFEEL